MDSYKHRAKASPQKKRFHYLLEVELTDVFLSSVKFLRKPFTHPFS